MRENKSLLINECVKVTMHASGERVSERVR